MVVYGEHLLRIKEGTEERGRTHKRRNSARKGKEEKEMENGVNGALYLIKNGKKEKGKKKQVTLPGRC